jgi:hypothetical protein
MAYRPLRRRSIAASLTIALEDQVARPIPAKRLGALSRVSRRCGSKGKRMAAGAGVPASIADRAAIVAALHVLCALPECARGALNALGVFAGFRRHRNCRNCIGTGGGSGMRCSQEPAEGVSGPATSLTAAAVQDSKRGPLRCSSLVQPHHRHQAWLLPPSRR